MAESTSLSSSSLTETAAEQKAVESATTPSVTESADSSGRDEEDESSSSPSRKDAHLNSPLYQAIIAFALRRKERHDEGDYSDSDCGSSINSSISSINLDQNPTSKSSSPSSKPKVQTTMTETTLELSAMGGIVLWACMMGHVPMLRQLFQAYHVQFGSRLADYADDDQRTAREYSNNKKDHQKLPKGSHDALFSQLQFIFYVFSVHLAAAGGQEAVCRYLLDEARVQVNPVDRWGHSPLDDAERFGRKTGRWDCHEMLKTKYGARPGPGNEETAMIKAAFHGDHKSVLRYAQARHLQGKQVNPPDYDDRTPCK